MKNTKPYRFLLGLVIAVFASFAIARAGELYLNDGDYINLDSIGASRYDVYAWVNASSDHYMVAAADFLGAYNSISGNYDVYLTIDYVNIHKVGSTWIAETVAVHDTFGNTTYYSNVAMASSGYVHVNMTDPSTGQYDQQGTFTVNW
jgi:hypothetical protein